MDLNGINAVSKCLVDTAKDQLSIVNLISQC